MAESKTFRAQVTVWFNETRGSRFEQWRPEARMTRSHFFQNHRVTVDYAEGDEPWLYSICDEMFRQGNADVRINGRDERSISIGDVVEVGIDGLGTFIFACAKFGWERLDAVVWDRAKRAQEV